MNKQKLKDIPFRVLVVDDQEAIGAILSDYLTSKGYDVFYADNGDDALAYIKRVRPHLALVDVRMVGMGGIEVLGAIREIDANVGIIMITALEDEKMAKKSLELGAIDFITKPIDLEYLDASLIVKLSAMLE